MAGNTSQTKKQMIGFAARQALLALLFTATLVACGVRVGNPMTSSGFAGSGGGPTKPTPSSRSEATPTPGEVKLTLSASSAAYSNIRDAEFRVVGFAARDIAKGNISSKYWPQAIVLKMSELQRSSTPHGLPELNVAAGNFDAVALLIDKSNPGKIVFKSGSEQRLSAADITMPDDTFGLSFRLTKPASSNLLWEKNSSQAISIAFNPQQQITLVSANSARVTSITRSSLSTQFATLRMIELQASVLSACAYSSWLGSGSSTSVTKLTFCLLGYSADSIGGTATITLPAGTYKMSLLNQRGETLKELDLEDTITVTDGATQTIAVNRF